MQFESRTYWHPKDIEFPKEYEDASAVGENGVVAIADGVSSAIFSRQWADILTRAVVESVPDLADGDAFQAWLADARVDWTNAIDFTKLSFFQRAKLQQAGGAYSTLLWVEFFPAADTDSAGEDDGRPYRCYAIGDCCLFHVRDGELLRKFPLETVEEFEADPVTICSVNRKRDHMLEFDTIDDTFHAGDLLILASDALAKWWYQQLTNAEAIDWDALWAMTSEDWSARVAELRNLPSERRMRVDDTTLILLRMGEKVIGEADVRVESSHLTIAPLSIEATDETVSPDVAASADVGQDTAQNQSTDETPCAVDLESTEAHCEISESESPASEASLEVLSEESCVARDGIDAHIDANDSDSPSPDEGVADVETSLDDEIEVTPPHSSSD